MRTQVELHLLPSLQTSFLDNGSHMDGIGPVVQSESRPYRSHKLPACDFCRKRKVRCFLDRPDQACRLCRQREQSCVVSQTKHKARIDETTSIHHGRPVIPEGSLVIGAESSDHANGREQFTSPTESNTLIANPTLAEDVDVLERYLTSQPATQSRLPKLSSRVSKVTDEPVIYLAAPRRRPNLSAARSCHGKEQRDIMDQVLGTSREDVIEL